MMRGMGRRTLPESKIPISSRVAPVVKSVIDSVAELEQRTASQAIEILLKESPRVKARLGKNGNRGKK